MVSLTSDLEKPADVSRLEDGHKAQCYLADAVEILTLRRGVNIKGTGAGPAVANTRIWWLSLGSLKVLSFLCVGNLVASGSHCQLGAELVSPRVPCSFLCRVAEPVTFLWVLLLVLAVACSSAVIEFVQ